MSIEDWTQSWRSARGGVGMLNPVYFSVGVRWLAWLVALGIFCLRTAPDQALEHAPAVLAVTGFQLLVMTLYLPVLGPRYRHLLETVGLLRWCEDNAALPVLDVCLGLAAVYFTGGWDSPFYHFALTTVLAPSLKYGFRGAVLASGGFLVGYLWVVTHSGEGWRAVYDHQGRLESGFVSTPFNPLMIAFFAALLSEVLERLRVEKEKGARLAAREERSRLTREIHDGVAQTLFMVNLSLENSLALAQREKAERTQQQLEKLLPVSRQALLEIRNAMFDLGPLLEGEQPMVAALAGLVREFKTVSRMEVEFECAGHEPSMTVPVRVALYRICQEALANACKHSGAGRVLLRLQFEEAGLEARLEDDGQGFEPDQGQGHGLGNMRSRAREVGGSLDLDSEPGC
ncbi:MAG: sensor histidine kinase [Candidatus Eremiobacteraeota bacterium]|nr:sensor histidine kinase [Candidatus Eremiobacteraeota bacterium]